MNNIWLILNIGLTMYYFYLRGNTKNAPPSSDELRSQQWLDNNKLRGRIGWFLIALWLSFYLYHNIFGIVYPWGEHPHDSIENEDIYQEW